MQARRHATRSILPGNHLNKTISVLSGYDWCDDGWIETISGEPGEVNLGGWMHIDKSHPVLCETK